MQRRMLASVNRIVINASVRGRDVHATTCLLQETAEACTATHRYMHVLDRRWATSRLAILTTCGEVAADVRHNLRHT